MLITRRTFGLAAFGGIAAPALLAPLPASAKAPHAGAQVPGVYRLKLGTMEVTVLNDGWLPIGASMYSGTPEGAEKLLASAFLKPDAIKTSVNEWLVNTGDKLVLIDTGTSNVFAPTLGRMAKNLAAAGIEPGAIDAVIISHMHPDHVAGVLTADKKVAFPNATVHIAEPEYAFWTSAEIAGKAPKEAKPFFDIAQAAIKPYAEAGRLVQFKDGAEIVPGITAVAAPGHTVGHTMFRLASGDETMLVWVDIVHNAALQFPEPERAIAFDADQAMATATRKKVFDMAATDRLLIAGAHLPFPGLGHVGRAGTGYAYVPHHWSADL